MSKPQQELQQSTLWVSSVARGQKSNNFLTPLYDDFAQKLRYDAKIFSFAENSPFMHSGTGTSHMSCYLAFTNRNEMKLQTHHEVQLSQIKVTRVYA
jgi:hypothetical protein